MCTQFITNTILLYDQPRRIRIISIIFEQMSGRCVNIKYKRWTVTFIFYFVFFLSFLAHTKARINVVCSRLAQQSYIYYSWYYHTASTYIMLTLPAKVERFLIFLIFFLSKKGISNVFIFLYLSDKPRFV